MAKTVGQVRFYGDGDKRNYPQGLTMSQLQSGVCFNDYYPIVQLGVQTLPGAKIYLNKDSEPIIVQVTELFVDPQVLFANIEVLTQRILMMKKPSDFLCKIGSNTLAIYIVHQPVIYGILYLLAQQ